MSLKRRAKSLTTKMLQAKRYVNRAQGRRLLARALRTKKITRSGAKQMLRARGVTALEIRTAAALIKKKGALGILKRRRDAKGRFA